MWQPHRQQVLEKVMNIPVAYLRIIKNRRKKGEYVNIAVRKRSDQRGHSVEGRGEEGGGAGLETRPPEATVCASSCGFACARHVRSCCGRSRKGGARMGARVLGSVQTAPCPGEGHWPAWAQGAGPVRFTRCVPRSQSSFRPPTSTSLLPFWLS